MKRSPLIRRTPLKRAGWLKPTRRRREATPAEWVAGLGACARCGSTENVQGHHLVARRTLRVLGLGAFLWDLRNRLALCKRCHERHETRVAPVPRELLPAAVWEFAAELDLAWYLERHYLPAAVTV